MQTIPKGLFCVERSALPLRAENQMNILSRKFKMRVPGTQHREYVCPTAWTCPPTEGVIVRKRMQVNPYAGTYI